eukprot:230870_1
MTEDKLYSKIKRTDQSLSIYYTLCNKSYYSNDGIGLFESWANDNGFDTDGIEEEFEVPAHESTLVDVDDNFPFPHGTKSTDGDAVIAVLKKCWDSGYAYSLIVNEDHFTIEQDKLEEKIINPLKSHCKTIFGKKFEDKS